MLSVIKDSQAQVLRLYARASCKPGEALIAKLELICQINLIKIPINMSR